MKVSIIAAIAGLTLVFGCAHHAERGQVAMALSEEDVHVCVDDNQVKPGDRVAFFTNECESLGGGAGQRATDRPLCRKVKIGEGQVTKNLNKHYAAVRVLDGQGKIVEGTMVEKVR